MNQYLNPLFFLLARSTDDELIQQIIYLKTENRMLRDRIPKKIYLKPHERRRLIELGLPIRRALRSLMTVVTYRTFCRWTQKFPAKIGSRKNGRPRTPKAIEELVIRIAQETGWGCGKIVGELYKLGIVRSHNTVRRILNEGGFHPNPNKDGSWKVFLKSHWETLWACDFFTKKVWTTRGLVECYVLFFIYLESRKVYYAGCTPNPNQQWVCQQARNFSMHVDDVGTKPSILIHDRDTKFTKDFDSILEAEGIEIKPLPFRFPVLNSIAERWVMSVKDECLNRFIVFGLDHLDYIIREYVKYYNRLRPHQGKQNQTLEKTPSKMIPLHNPESQIHRKDFLGGVLNHYYSTQPPDDFKITA